MFQGKPKATPIIDWAQTAIAEIRRLERELKARQTISALRLQRIDELRECQDELKARDQTIAELQRQIDKQESLIGELNLRIEAGKNGRML